MNGTFVISLDFELLWGMRDHQTIESYGAHIAGVHQVIPQLLDLFDSFEVKGTFATVGFLFLEDKQGFEATIPSVIPKYTNQNLSPYPQHIATIGANHEEDVYHYAPQLIRLIQQYPDQEISSHTFSHYYCLENGQTVAAFRADLQAAQQVAKDYGIQMRSLVFPRNQFNDAYLQVCAEEGFICIRGNERSWLYEARSKEKESLFRRACRLADAYVNISGHHCYSEAEMGQQFPIDIPSSRFLRPYSHKLRFLESLRLSRIKKSMTYAAKKGLCYHLWWHPHNFGKQQKANFAFLYRILAHYKALNKAYGFQSITMSTLAEQIQAKNYVRSKTN